MSDGAEGFVDYFWGDNLTFDATNTAVWRKATRVLYLHGALHIYRLPSGETVKRTTGETGEANLLNAVGTPYMETDMPLFVTEGAAKSKLEAIRRSEYLNFAYKQFSEHHGPLVVFGHSLGETDAHLLKVMGAWEDPVIAVSMRPDRPQRIIAKKAALYDLLPKATIIAFQAETHPLGDHGLLINP
jgi:hypothetical protein